MIKHVVFWIILILVGASISNWLHRYISFLPNM